MAETLCGQKFNVQENNVIEPPANPPTSSVPPLPNALANTLDSLPNEPVDSDFLVERYGVGNRRTVQVWVRRLIEESGITESELKAAHGNQSRYTSYCVELLDSLHAHRFNGGKMALWFKAQQKEKSPPVPSSLPSNSETSTSDASSLSGSSVLARVGIVPSDIPLATDQQHSILDNAIKTLSPATVDLNGQQEYNLAGIETLLGVVDQAAALNDQRQAELRQRAATVEKSEKVLELVRDRLTAEQQRAKKLNESAAEIAEKEQQVADQLGKLGIS